MLLHCLQREREEGREGGREGEREREEERSLSVSSFVEVISDTECFT